MCGRYTLQATPAQIADFFALTREPEIHGRMDYVPTQCTLGVRVNDTTYERELDIFRWGLIPSWASADQLQTPLILARAETVTEKPAFRDAFSQQRCLIPASGYFEWVDIPGIKKKQPHYFQLRDQALMAFAAIWDQPNDPDLPNGGVKSCAIITTTANSQISQFHDRMPLLLHQKDFSAWLDPSQTPQSLKSLLQADRAEEFVISRSLAEELLGKPHISRQRSLFED